MRRDTTAAASASPSQIVSTAKLRIDCFAERVSLSAPLCLSCICSAASSAVRSVTTRPSLALVNCYLRRQLHTADLLLGVLLGAC